MNDRDRPRGTRAEAERVARRRVILTVTVQLCLETRRLLFDV
jgi:hypothetical protein